MKIKVLVFFTMVILISACGGGTGSSGDPNADISQGLDAYFPTMSGFTATFTDGDAMVDANTGPFERSNVSLEILEGNILHITSVLDFDGFVKKYHADCDETHELVIEGNSIKLAKSTVVLNWTGETPETWTQVWEYDPPVTLVEDRTAISPGTITTENVNIAFSGHEFTYVDPEDNPRLVFPPPSEPVNFEVNVSDAETLEIGSGSVDAYEFRIVFIYGIEYAPVVDVPRYTTFEAYSILIPGFHLALGEGIVKFGTGIIKE